MTALSNAQFAEYMIQLAQSAPAFQPTAIYDRDGDCLEFLASPEPFYAERIDDLVTVYYSQEKNEIVGSLIKGISRFCRQVSEKIPGFKIEVQDGPMKLQHLFFLAKLCASPEPASIPTLTYRKEVYRKLIEVAERSNTRAELACA